MSALTRWVLAHKRIVTVGWIVLTIAGIMAAGPATEALEPEFSVPDKEGWETNQEIAANYAGTGGDTAPLVPVVTLAEGESIDSEAVTADLEALDAALAEALPNSRIASYASTGDDAFVSDDGTTTFAVVYPQPDPDSAFGENPAAEKAASKAVEGATVGGAQVHLTGFDALFEDSGEDADGPSLLIEALIGGFGALLVLIFVFASFLAVVPLLMAFVSIMTTFLLLLGLTEITTVSPIVQFLIALIGLGVAIDYSLIVVSRWREERTHGASDEEAVQKAMETAGRAVVFSGITVAIGLLALIALPLPFLRSMGYGGMLIPLVSTLVAITLLPIVLAKFGAKLDWPHRRTDDKASRTWTRWAEAVSRRRWLAAGLGMAVVFALVGASFGLQLGTSDANTLAQGGDAKDGLDALVDSGVGEGALLPHEILIDGSTPPGDVAADLNEVEGIHGAVAPSDESWNQNGTALVEAIPIPDSGSSEGEENLEAVRDTAHAAGPDVAVGGQPAANADFIDAVYGSFPLMIALIAISTFILLAQGVPLDPPSDQGDHPQHPERRRSVGCARDRLAERQRLRAHLGRRGDGLDPVLDPPDGLRLPVRPLDGLRGLHPEPDAGGVRPNRVDRHGRDPGHRPDRAPGHERRPDPVPRLHGDGVRAGNRRPDHGHGPRRRDPPGRHRHPGADRARGDLADGPLELVAAQLEREAPAGRAVAADAGREPRLDGAIAGLDRCSDVLSVAG